MKLAKKLRILEYKLKPLRNLTKQTTNLKFPLYSSFRSPGPQKAKYCNGSSFAYLEITATKKHQENYITLHKLQSFNAQASPRKHFCSFIMY